MTMDTLKFDAAGLIPAIVNEIPDRAVIYLINALAFEGEWEDIYREDQVHDGAFTTEDGREQPAELMYGGETAYLKDSLATGFLKYYKGQSYAFAALLPEAPESRQVTKDMISFFMAQ